MTEKYINSLNLISQNYFNKNYTEFFPEELREQSKIPDLRIFDKNAIENINKIEFNITDFTGRISEGFFDYAKKIFSINEFLDFLYELATTLTKLGSWKLAERHFNFIIDSARKEKSLIDYAANSYLSLGEIYFRQAKWEESLKFLEKAKGYFNSERFLEGLVKTYNLIGAVLGEKGDFKKAEKYFLDSLELINTQVYSDLLKGMIEDNIGLVNYSRSLYDEAFSYFNRATNIFDSLKSINRLCESYFNLGLVYQKKNDLEATFSKFDKSLEFAIQTEYVTMINLNLSAKANAYASLNDFDQSFAFLNKSMDLSTAINDRLTIADLYKIKGILSKKLKKKKKAEKSFLTSLRLNEELENKFNYFETMFELGLLYKEWGKNDLAKEKLIKAFNYKTKIGAENAAKNINRELKEL